MNNSGMKYDEIDRLMQEAELYETQGLYEQAIRVYHNVLAKEPGNQKAQSRISLIERAQRAENVSEGSRLRPEELSPRLALDLGLAYMGMNLYAEAIEEFARALKISPAIRPDLLRYTITCLIHMERLEKARKAMDQLLEDQSLTLTEKGNIVSDTANLYLEKGLPELADSLLQRLTAQQKEFVRDYDRLLVDASSRSKEQDFELEIEDTDTGRIYTQPPSSEATARRSSGIGKEAQVAAIPLRTAISYSLDSRNWHDGITESISAQWAVLQLDEQVTAGDSLVVQLRLPAPDQNDVISIISKVSDLPSQDRSTDAAGVKVDFVSFLPGGESVLKSFIEKALQDPSMLRESVQPEAPSTPSPAKPQVGEPEPEIELDTEPLPEVLRKSIRPSVPFHSSPTAGALALMAKLDAEGIQRIHFACDCGQIHVVPAKNAGRKGKCASCGEVLTVPNVDTRPDSLSDRVIGQVVGGCRVLFKLGGGGMGGVFKGHHVALDIPVAVKILHAHLADKDPVFIKRFIREARAAAKLQHPNIVGVMNVGFENGLHYLVMPFVSGGSAAAVLTKSGRLPIEQVLEVAMDMARALILAEEHNLLHRDIKPANILFDEKGAAKLADLGLAKSYLEGQDVGITQTGIACGTPLYFSPEQAKGARHLDIRSDIYSLGITVYHLINGSPPFKGESAYVIFQKHVHEPLPPFDEGVPQLPDAVMELLKTMTAKNPDERFASAQGLLEALEALRAELQSAAPPAPPAPTRRKGILARLGLKKTD